MVTKSSRYSTSYDEEHEIFMLLCEVALGVPKETKTEDRNPNLVFAQSKKGCGRYIPAPSETVEFDGVMAAAGRPINIDDGSFDLFYNEYIVYKESQVKLRYLVQITKEKKI